LSISFIKSLRTISEQYSDKKAFHINDVNYSYLEFYEKVNNIIHEIINEKNKRKRIIVTTNNDVETYAAIIAIWLTGNVYIPLNIREDNERIRSAIDVIEADIVLTSQQIEDCFGALKVINTSKLPQLTRDIPKFEIKEKDIAYILFTSGSTGTPKGVPVNYQNLDAFVDSFLNLDYSLTNEDTFLQMADLTFDMSIISTLIPLCIGASICTIDNEEIKYLATYKALSEQNISVLVTAPSTLQLLKPYYSEINLENLNYTFVGAEAFYETTAKQWQGCAPNSQIINLYGPSEGGILSSAYTWNKIATSEHKGIVSIGKEVKNIHLHIVDKLGNIITNNEEGEAWISGNQIFHSYLNESMNKDEFGYLSINGEEQKCYKTGDLMFRNNEGNLFYCGRKDQQVKIQGKRIELGEIEYYANKIPGKFQAVAITFNGNSGSTQIALFIDKEIELMGISEVLKNYLPAYMVPSKIIGIADLPLNKNQKVDKKQLESYIVNN
jgi:amino acid adenylation domain-containing protein